jgi:hypothetical protein
MFALPMSNFSISAFVCDGSVLFPNTASTERFRSRNIFTMRVLSEIAKEALDLPPVQRRMLARILLDLSEDDQDFSPEVEVAWEQEICQRMSSVTAGTARSRSFDDVFAELDRRFAP